MKLTEPVECRKAVLDDIDDIMLTVRQARNYLKKHRVDQWQGEYPAEALLEQDIARGECYVLTYGGRVAGFFVLSTKPEACYEDLTDGKWRSEEPYCTLHRSAVMAQYRGSGLSRKMLGFVEELARQQGCFVLRADTHKHNKAMRNLLLGGGWSYRGNVLVFSEPYHDPRRQAFDKILDNK